jgi:hypothetical protein
MVWESGGGSSMIANTYNDVQQENTSHTKREEKGRGKSSVEDIIVFYYTLFLSRQLN